MTPSSAMLTDSDKQVLRDYCRAHADEYRWGGVLDVRTLAYDAAYCAEHSCREDVAKHYALSVCEELAEIDEIAD